jgi:hypothetical protein
MRRLVVTVTAFLLLAAPAHARPGDLDRSFANGGRAAYKVFGLGGAIESLALLDGGRPLLSVSSYRPGAFSPLFMRLTARGRVAARTLIPGPVAETTRFEDGHALTATGVAPGVPRTFSFARIGSARSS